ncbi:hypothetical protein SAMN04487972_10153 [Paracoccus halophilus]|uniref:Lipoyl synthase n=1 Tax=Paracoccus halophilus TaxID=376733 RepID=A0A099F8G7_9RHOB|nr:hypothetical protein [Paracoccus halophilus]KGJ06498.1 lipoyl synthase [Paracoccus halophilus]SFA37961.1 hypothetical protein SAMN04487972_10153 [Paracoccus halophilus]
MNNLLWLIRASRWARNPPRARMVMLVLAIIALGLALKGLEYWGLMPEWASMERPPRGIRLER